jgi:hypothetical protein
VRDSFGVPRTLEVVAVVKSVSRAQATIDDFTKHLTEQEKKSVIFFCWEYTSRRIGRGSMKISAGSGILRTMKLTVFIRADRGSLLPLVGFTASQVFLRGNINPHRHNAGDPRFVSEDL